ncbi:MAG: hypothetical protein IPH45_11115 [Bacteroidales bacterium]|nr:hypothetical protein [Bacteroidales bacterium]
MRMFSAEFMRQARHGDLGTFVVVIISVILAIITFPELNPVYANGIDPPLSWVFNFLVQGRLQLGKDIIFPHGPLAFLMYPLPVGNNLIITAFIYFLAKASFSYSLLTSRISRGLVPMISSLIISFLLLAYLDFLLILIGIVLIGYLNYFLSRNLTWLLLPILVTTAAIYIKAFVGIVCVMLSMAFILILILEIIKEKRSFRHLLFIPVIPLSIIAGWFFLYGDFNGFSRYFKGMLELAGDNSAAVAYYPANNWYYLSIAGLLSGFLAFLQIRQANAVKYVILVLPSLFAVWKYGMAREDYLHASMFFLYVAVTILIFLLLAKHHRIVISVMGGLILLLLYGNLQKSYYYEPIRGSFNGLRQLNQLVSGYQYFADTCNDASIENVQRNRLESACREKIGKATADIYPWDYSYISVNHLNWQPRPVLQSYACYTPWLDEQNASHFSSAKAPDYLIWELRKITHDIHNGTLESIDGRYLLNDQPETVLSILSRYQLACRQGGTFPALIFQKRESPLDLKKNTILTDTAAWNRWVDVPDVKEGILRLKASINRSLLGDLKSFLYKDEACYVYYLLSTDEIRIYRIVPKNAIQGIWVNPLILNAESNRSEPIVKKIMFRCSEPGLMKELIPYEWENVQFVSKDSENRKNAISYSDVDIMFGKVEQVDTSFSIFSSNDLESRYIYWSENLNPETKHSFSGKTSCRLKSESYSFSYEISLDTLLKISDDTSWIIRTDAWAYAENDVDGSFVISIEGSKEPVIWKGIRLNDFLFQKGEWNYVTNFLTISRDLLLSQPLRLKIYSWNQGNEEFLIDDFRIFIKPE